MSHVRCEGGGLCSATALYSCRRANLPHSCCSWHVNVVMTAKFLNIKIGIRYPTLAIERKKVRACVLCITERSNCVMVSAKNFNVFTLAGDVSRSLPLCLVVMYRNYKNFLAVLHLPDGLPEILPDPTIINNIVDLLEGQRLLGQCHQPPFHRLRASSTLWALWYFTWSFLSSTTALRNDRAMARRSSLEIRPSTPMAPVARKCSTNLRTSASSRRDSHGMDASMSELKKASDLLTSMAIARATAGFLILPSMLWR